MAWGNCAYSLSSMKILDCDDGISSVEFLFLRQVCSWLLLSSEYKGVFPISICPLSTPHSHHVLRNGKAHSNRSGKLNIDLEGWLDSICYVCPTVYYILLPFVAKLKVPPNMPALLIRSISTRTACDASAHASLPRIQSKVVNRHAAHNMHRYLFVTPQRPKTPPLLEYQGRSSLVWYGIPTLGNVNVCVYVLP
ncbi:hypothetical protein IQ07DRAFT_278072 [Pyrenochaeta sp. DS3sAY3a]|nr:hypothetical protein IQ07DRAFT_278072 [Pyrenochaeta sp. DS3sAY3a]